MFIIDNLAALHLELTTWRLTGAKIALVPTMGNLHAGHLQLIEAGKRYGDKIVASIFVNPMQFNDANDLQNYPRTLQNDVEKLQNAGVDLVFTPSVAEMYPHGQDLQTVISVPRFAHIHEGAHRPGHFDGVATVVGKLFNMIAPDFALFGKKDFQQLMLIKAMVRDLNFSVQLIGVEIVRAADGLALSSRNALLSNDERKVAPVLYATLCALRDAIVAGEPIGSACDHAKDKLQNAGLIPDYISVCARANLAELTEPEGKMVILAAAKLGEVRLIDNLELDLSAES